MGIKEDYQKAQALAQKGNFEDARKLLIAHDHPKTNALLKKVNEAILAGRQSNGTEKKKGLSCVRLLAAIVLAAIILYVLGNVIVFVPT